MPKQKHLVPDISEHQLIGSSKDTRFDVIPQKLVAYNPLEIKKNNDIERLPVVMTTPASTFLRACGDVKFSVSSRNFSITKRETASART